MPRSRAHPITRKRTIFLDTAAPSFFKKRWKDEENGFAAFMRAAAKLFSDRDKIKPQDPEEFIEEPLAVDEIVSQEDK